MAASNTSAQYKARLNLVRQMDMITKHYNMAWNVSGSFMRHLLGGGRDAMGTSNAESNMVFLLTPSIKARSDITIDRVLRIMNRMKGEMEVMGIIDTTAGEAQYVGWYVPSHHLTLQAETTNSSHC
jgi:hypothetical protein